MRAPTIVPANKISCSECSTVLSAVETWPGRRLLQCGKMKCRRSAQKRGPLYEYVFANTTTCEGPDCGNLVPEGTYDFRAKFKVCSDACFRKVKSKGWVWFKCSHCGNPCRGRRRSGHHFCSGEHQGLFVTNEALSRCGRFTEIIKEYLDGWAKIRYRSVKTVRSSLLAFCEFLIANNILSMDDVTPRVITQYLAWGIKSRRNHVPYSISAIATFFNWQIAERDRKTANPVVKTMHYRKEKRRNPRPLDQHEIALAWEILDSRGTNLQRLAFAIAIEGGLRIGEIPNLKVADVDQLRQTIRVGLPNKTMKERTTFFHTKTKQHLEPWLEERSKGCSHDYLFHNEWGRQASADMLRRQFNDLFCDPKQEKRFEKWSTHRLRHTMATALANAGGKIATISAVGGWANLTTMLGYIDADENVARAGYLEAVRISEKKKEEPSASEFSMNDYLSLPGDA